MPSFSFQASSGGVGASGHLGIRASGHAVSLAAHQISNTARRWSTCCLCSCFQDAMYRPASLSRVYSCRSDNKVWKYSVRNSVNIQSTNERSQMMRVGDSQDRQAWIPRTVGTWRNPSSCRHLIGLIFSEAFDADASMIMHHPN